MNQEERTKLHIAQSLIEGKMTIKDAAEVSGLSSRQWIRIKKGVLEHGDVFVIHKNKGRKPHNAIPDLLVNQVVELKTTDIYSMANFTHFQELIEEHENLSLSNSSVYRILASNGFVSPKKHTRKNLHHRRKRKPRKGMLVVADASPHHWFFDDREVSLHGAIDDATGEILALFFTPNECLQGYFEVVRSIVNNYDCPLAFYVDKHTIFRSPKAGKLTLEDELAGLKVKDTQFGRAMRELGINLIYANSPQAKGRIERLWNTLQSRLPVELNIAAIKTIDDANRFLQSFIAKYNAKFAVPPKEPESAFRALDPKLNLNYILCTKQTRVVDNGSAFSFSGQYYRILRKDKVMPVIPNAKVTILKSPVFGILAEYSGSTYEVEKLQEKPKKTVKPKPNANTTPTVPSPLHPWRSPSKSKPAAPLISSLLEESDQEIINALYSSRLAWR